MKRPSGGRWGPTGGGRWWWSAPVGGGRWWLSSGGWWWWWWHDISFFSGEPPPQKVSSFCSELLEPRGGANTAFYVRAYVGSIVELWIWLPMGPFDQPALVLCIGWHQHRAACVGLGGALWSSQKLRTSNHVACASPEDVDTAFPCELVTRHFADDFNVIR